MKRKNLRTQDVEDAEKMVKVKAKMVLSIVKEGGKHGIDNS